MTEFLDWLGYQAVKVFGKFIRALPLSVALKLGAFLGFLFYLISSRRRVAYADLKAALGSQLDEKKRWQVIREHYQNYGQMFVEVLRIPLLERSFIEKHIKVDHLERYQQILQENQGCVLITAHFGNWELLQIISGILGKPVHVLARNQKHNRLNQYLNELREAHGSVAVQRGMGVRELLRSLRRRELIGVLGDQDAGRQEGLILRFFGRKTTVPTGAFELAARTGASILPCFIARKEGAYHQIFVGKPMVCGEGKIEKEALEEKAQDYLKVLEDLIKQYPSQWLWESKRWKFSWTKRILILSDGKAGHQKQSEAVAAQFSKIKTQYDRPGMEYPTEILQVRYRSKVHRFLFSIFAFFFIPFAQGRLRYLGFFFEAETQKQIEAASADFVISAGSSLTPLNLCLAKDSRAKTLVLMKPLFPYRFFRFDLVIVPAHDRGFVPERSLRTFLAPQNSNSADLVQLRDQFSRKLKDPSKVKIAIFLGGKTRQYDLPLSEVQELFRGVQRLAAKVGDFVVTTSRRTSEEVALFLKDEIAKDARCQRVVIASEDASPEVAYGMLAIAEVLIVTEDSISMISEAVATGKKVLVITFGNKGPSAKHKRFRDILSRESAIVTASVKSLEEGFRKLLLQPSSHLAAKENSEMIKRLQEIL